MTTEESNHVTQDESNPKPVEVKVIDCACILEKISQKDNEELDQEQNENQVTEEKLVQNQISSTPQEHPDLPKEWIPTKDHLIQNVIGGIFKGVATQQHLNKVCNFVVFVSQIEPIGINKVIVQEHWSSAIQQELNQFERNNILELVPKASANLVIGAQRVFRNKLDGDENVLINKVRLVTKGYMKKQISMKPIVF